MKPQEKQIQFYMTPGVAATYGGLELMVYSVLVEEMFAKTPIDMYVFDYDAETEETVVWFAGYDFRTDVLIEDVVAQRMKSLPITKFWCKIDDYGDRYLALFLLPSEY